MTKLRLDDMVDPPLDFDDTLDFGKYHDCTIQQLLELHPSYLQWCLDNIPDFNVTDEVREAIEAANDVEEY